MSRSPVVPLVLLAVLAFLSIAPPSVFATTLTRHPYVNLVTTSSATIAWHTDVATTGTVAYSKDLAYDLSATDGVTDTIHVVTVTGLDPGEIYFYRVTAGPDTLTAPNDIFQTSPGPSSTAQFTFFAFGDLGKATNDQKDVADQMSGGANLAILTGNIIYDAGERENFDPQYFQIYQSDLANLPFYTALGETDIGTGNGQPYLDNFILPTNSATNSERYYSFDYGNAHFVCLEVTQEDTAPNATMLTWLDADLAATAQTWKFVYFHVPAYSNGGGHGGDPTIAAALEPIFMNRGVDVVFQGHNNFYTRTYPLVSGVAANQAQNPVYQNPSGPIWITTGGGGASLDALTSASSIEAFSVSAFHYVAVVITGNVLGLAAIGSDGTVLDNLGILKTPTTAITMSDFQAVGDPDGVRLRWTRVDGGDEGGFNVYRAPYAEGPWARLNPDLLRGSSTFEYVDRDAAAGVAYAYRLGIVDGRGQETMTSAITAERGAPLRFALERPRPNPARGTATIPFTLDRAAATRVTIVDVNGRAIRTLASRALPAGPHALTWDGRDDGGRAVASGLYFAVVRAGEREARARVALLR